jgi:hypothetical protein
MSGGRLELKLVVDVSLMGSTAICDKGVVLPPYRIIAPTIRPEINYKFS